MASATNCTPTYFYLATGFCEIWHNTFSHDFKMSEDSTMFLPNIVLPWLINTRTTFYFRSVTAFPAMNVFFKPIKTNEWKNIHFRPTFLSWSFTHCRNVVLYFFCPPIRSQAVPSWSLPSSLHVSPSTLTQVLLFQVTGNEVSSAVVCLLDTSVGSSCSVSLIAVSLV